MVKQCLMALCLGMLFTIWFLQHDAHTKQYIGNLLMQTMQKTCDCRMEGDTTSLTLFPPAIVYENVCARAHNDQWTWQAHRLRITTSWLDIIFHKTLPLYLNVDTCRIDSLWHGGTVALSSFIEAIYKAPPIKLLVVLKSLDIRHGHMVLRDPKYHLKLTNSLSGNFKKIGKYLKAIFHLRDTTLSHRHHHEITEGKGTIALRIGGPEVACSIDYQYLLNAYPHAGCTLTASWDGTQGIFCTKSTDNMCSIVVKAQRHNTNMFSSTLESILPLSVFSAYIPNKYLKNCSGKIVTKATGSPFPTLKASGWIEAHDLCYNNNPLAHRIAANFSTDTNICSGTALLAHPTNTTAEGSWCYNFAQSHLTASLKGTSHAPIALSDQWHLDPSSVHITTTGNLEQLTTTYQADIEQQTKKEIKCIQGTVTTNQTHIDLEGSCDDLQYTARIQHAPRSYLQALTVNSATKPCINLYASDPTRFHATLHLSHCAPYVPLLNQNTIQTEGTLEIEGLWKHNCLYAACSLHHGALRFTQLHNIIKQMSARAVIDYPHRSITIRDLSCVLHRGTMTCSRATLGWNTRYMVDYLHAPIEFDRCFVHYTKDLFAILSGYIVASWNHDAIPHIAGTLFIDKAQLKYNLFSSQLSQHLFGTNSLPAKHQLFDTSCDLTIHTKDPLRVKTVFLETDVKLTLKLTGSLHKPSLLGSIELLSGEFIFPYKPLYISKGSILFSPRHDDPAIYLSAQNVIKNHYINLLITGSLNNPKLFLEASPHLSEMQIFSLLLIGTEHHSLGLAVPAVIANNLKNLLFSADQTLPSLDHYMHRLLKPLRSIHVLPGYTDQSGRGGVRGALEVEVTDRLRAYLQKNFSLTEDTRIEIDYTLSDEIRLKGMRNERGDIGAEVEMRWKF